MKILSKYEIKTGSRLGIFIAGYRWSGSGAVSDWLAGHSGLCRVEGSEAAFGEIRAINYGLRFLVQTAAGRIRYGERLGRWALCPDPELWGRVLGSPLTRERGRFAGLYTFADALYFMAARFHIIPRVTKYKQLLDAQLGMDFREDKEYLFCVETLADSLRSYMHRIKEEKSKSDPEDNDDVVEAASSLLSLFHRRLSENGRVLIFDNAISGLYPESFGLVSSSIFPGQIIIFVRRDPRDQFAELVKYSGSTFPWSVGKFIRQYRATQERTKKFVENISVKAPEQQDPNNSILIRQVSFEDFVLDRNNVRTRLKEDLQIFWKAFGISTNGKWLEADTGDKTGDGMNSLFNADRSKLNIGIWRNSKLKKQMNRITAELSDYIE